MPMAECIFESPVEHVNANVDETLNSVTVPSHLLLLRHPFRDDFVDYGLGEFGRYPRSRLVALTVIRHRVGV